MQEDALESLGLQEANDEELSKSFESLKEERVFTAEELLIDYSGLLDMQVEFSSYLGTVELSLAEILKLQKGSIIDLRKPAGESVEIFINQRIIGKGEIMVYEKNLAIRVNEILDSKTVIEYFSREK
ncbi:MAG: flagellar motor switch protein FliN [Campylobacteraceae bacterium]|jgi:flagellar motor switch protein FliN/FliY|nr:flagellar motor switch protein FliN [Campylobacteraceae bacterium]